MLRLRFEDGSLAPLPANARFIEFCDLDGRIAAVAYTDDRGVMHFLKQGEPSFRRYLALFPQEAGVAKVVALPT